MTSQGQSDPDPGEQAAEQLHRAVCEAVDDWVEDESSTAFREGDNLVINEDELVEKIQIMTALTLDAVN